MGILILSDTHGLVQEVKQVVASHEAEMIFHCGDFCVDHDREPFTRMKLVRGNCDWTTDTDVPEERITLWKALTIYQTHGHLYGVKRSLLQLHYRAEETGANIVLFGHSHLPLCVEERGILFINPGSLQFPRGFDVPTYARLSIINESSPQGIQVDVAFYSNKGKAVSGFGGQYSLRR